ncbi:40S ribosomal protein S27A (nucleomorph) [Chroomonas mesostigmatica CCMP1168]|uniref:40S ribosomal protein S27A n=1 Tax=Chroomonas mesostigmatica CCMP1168 TaxID=1195612 RepID=J7G3N7_9CRYP|nr:40S ribosomal protein S27A [Chroomonas mesostigmatica CCMP1168]
MGFRFTGFYIKQFFSSNRMKTLNTKNFLKIFSKPFFSPCKVLKKLNTKRLKKTLLVGHKFRLIGGGKKRKKKNYTKPKKIKHVKKTIKLRILTYYSISEGKIRKLKKNSPHFLGCFMADHHDRMTCGKTGLTIARHIPEPTAI